MPDDTSLAGRLDAEFATVKEKVKRLQAQHLEEYKGREKRVEQLDTVFDELSAIWKQRLELRAKRIGGGVETTTGPLGPRRPVA
jgi:hypothetical protein